MRRGRLRVPFGWSLQSYLFFFFAAFLVAFFAAFFVAITILPFPFSWKLRHHIIAICSLYRVLASNSQEKNARSRMQLVNG